MISIAAPHCATVKPGVNVTPRNRIQCVAHHVLQTSFSRGRCEDAYGICEALYSRTRNELKMKMKSVTDLEGSKIRVLTAIRCAPFCGIGRLMLGVNTNVGFLNLD